LELQNKNSSEVGIEDPLTQNSPSYSVHHVTAAHHAHSPPPTQTVTALTPSLTKTTTPTPHTDHNAHPSPFPSQNAERKATNMRDLITDSTNMKTSAAPHTLVPIPPYRRERTQKPFQKLLEKWSF
jgi:hypothetical protein